jgi:hypothetical protein
MIGIDKWNIQFSSKLDIVKLIIDCTFLAPLLKNDGDLEHLHKLSSELEEWLLWLFCLEAIENYSGFSYEIC